MGRDKENPKPLDAPAFNTPAKSCPKWFQIISWFQIVSTGVATFTDTIVRLHCDAALAYRP